MPRLPKFEGQEVMRSAVKITKAGDGLSDSLRLDPSPLHMDEDVYFVLRGKVRQINHVPTGPADDTLQRVHTIVTEEIARLDEEIADPLLREAAAILAEKRASEIGQDTLPGAEHGADGIPVGNVTEIGSAAGKAKPTRKRAPRKPAAE